jgi:phosphoribosylanthranilate isomerase
MTKVKICGITNLEDALFAAEAGADALGFIFYAKSPRCIAPDRAREIILRLPPFVAKVGVFVNAPPVSLPTPALSTVEGLGGMKGGAVKEIMAHCHLDYAQLHGDEPPEQVAALAPRAIKAVRVRSAADVERLAQYQAVAYLLDAYHPTKPGGTGETWDWELAAAAKRYGPVVLAGGLTPDNVAAAIERVHPYAVDVSSGVEATPGIKDHRKVRRFIIAAKGA